MAAVTTATLVVTVTKENPTSGQGQTGNKRKFHATVTWGSNGDTYTTGGVAATAAQLNVSALSAIDDIHASEAFSYEGTTKRDGHIKWDRENSKFMLYAAAGTEVANASDVGAWVSRIAYYATEA